MPSSTETIRAADGTPLRLKLEQSLFRNRLRAFGLVSPLLLFITVLFVIPIVWFLCQSVYDNRFSDLMPETSMSLEKWDGVTIVGKDASSYVGKPSAKQIVAQTAWPRISSVDVIGGDTKALFQRFPEPEQSSDFLRIINFIPKMGAELHEKVIPAETGLVEKSVSFTKGCYTGQELVARIDSRGNKVPKNLMLITCNGAMSIGDEVEVDGVSTGQISSVASASNLTVGLAYIARKVASSTLGTIKGKTVSINSQKDTFSPEGQ